MRQDFTITKIEHVIFVGPDKYHEEKTAFRKNLECNELIFHFSGTATVYFDDQILKTAPNTLRFLPKGQVSRYDVVRSQAGSCIDVFFQTDKPVDLRAFTVSVNDGSQIGALFKRLFSIWVSKEDAYYFECISLLYRILAQMQRHSNSPQKQFTKIEPAIHYIKENFLSESISVDSLAQAAGISYSYLKKLFIQRFHLSPKQYIIQLKMNYACDLLCTERYSVAQVAEQCGFRDVYFFSRQFKSHVGVSPTTYKNVAPGKSNAQP